MFKLMMGAVLALSAASAVAGDVTFAKGFTAHVPDKIEEHYGDDKEAMLDAIIRLASERSLVAGLSVFQLDRRIGTHIPQKDEILLKNGIDVGAKMGMSKDQVLARTHWGKPNYINSTTDELGKIEQWIYGNHLKGAIKYLIFDRNKLISIRTPISR